MMTPLPDLKHVLIVVMLRYWALLDWIWIHIQILVPI